MAIKKNEETTAIATTENHNSALVAAPEFLDVSDFESGFEGTDQDSYALPFLQVLQKMSPKVDEDDPEYVPGAKAGMFYDTVSGKLYDGKEGLQIIPCAFKRSFIQWGPRGSNGGFKGEFTPLQYDELVRDGKVAEVKGRSYLLDENGKYSEKESDYIADTRSHYVLVIDPKTGEATPAILSLSSTMIKASRTLMTRLRERLVTTPQGKRTPPTYANIVRITTVAQSNDQGTWSGVKFDIEGFVSDKATFEAAKSFWKSVNAGEVKADHSKNAPDVVEEGGEKTSFANEF